MSTLRLLAESGVEDLKVLQTVLLIITTTDVVQGKPLSKVCVGLCSVCVCGWVGERACG